MRELEILEPKTVDEAVRLLAELGDEAKVLGGGTALILMYTQRLIDPRYLVSLGRIQGLNYIRYEPGVGLRLGALTPHRAVERSSLVRKQFPVVAEVFHQVANVRIRNQATVGGVLAEADYASDPPSVLIALGARVNIVGPGGQRSLPVSELIKGFFETDLAPDEIITEVIVPDLPANSGATYLKFVTRSSEDRPCVGVAALVQRSRDTICDNLQVVIGAVAPIPQKLPEAETLAKGEKLTESLAREIGRRYAQAIDPLSDMRGSSWYRKQVIEVLVRRAIEQAAGGG
ncbi:MAG: xanthine dehydrogenase family protein subunit M [Anaerolineae bacterium]